MFEIKVNIRSYHPLFKSVVTYDKILSRKGVFCNMKYCESCGAQVADDAAACPKCGHGMKVAPKGKTWANVLGIIAMVFGIIGVIFSICACIPYTMALCLYPALAIGFTVLALSIVCRIFASKKGVCTVGIVFGGIDTFLALVGLVYFLVLVLN